MSARLSPAPHPSFSSLSSAPGAARAPRWLFSRDLVGSGYAETYTATNGSQVTERLQRQVGPPCSCPGPAAGAGSRAREWGPHTLLPQDHCFYQGRVAGHPHSAASLSTCAGLRWVLRARRPSPSRGVTGAQEEGVCRGGSGVPGATDSEPHASLPQGLLPGGPRRPPDRAPGGGRGGRATRPVPGAAPAAGGWHLWRR